MRPQDRQARLRKRSQDHELEKSRSARDKKRGETIAQTTPDTAPHGQQDATTKVVVLHRVAADVGDRRSRGMLRADYGRTRAHAEWSRSRLGRILGTMAHLLSPRFQANTASYVLTIGGAEGYEPRP